MTQKIIIIMFLCVLFIGCNKQGESEDGIGTDPKLNIEEYVFPKEGGSLEVSFPIKNIEFFGGKQCFLPRKTMNYIPYSNFVKVEGRTADGKPIRGYTSFEVK